MPPPKERNQEHSDVAHQQVVRDVAKLEVRQDALAAKLANVDIKATLALGIQLLNLGILGFIMSKLFDISSQITTTVLSK